MTGPTAGRRPPKDASMSLLNEVMLSSLDPGYQVAARAANGRPVPTRRRVIAALVAVCVGIGGGTAIAQLRSPDPDVVSARASLERRVVREQASLKALQRQQQTLTSQVDALKKGAGPARTRAATTQDMVATGTTPVTGPGFVVTVSDGPSNLVRDYDVKFLVNALWSGGAEAISVNDRRLTSLSSIRNAGSAILVDLQPVVSPYRIQAIGDGEALQIAMIKSGADNLLTELSTQYGITSSGVTQSSLSLPAAAPETLWYARPAEPVHSNATPSGGATSTPKTSGHEGDGGSAKP